VAKGFCRGLPAGADTSTLCCGEFLLLLEECSLAAEKGDLTLSHAVELFTLVNEVFLSIYGDKCLITSILLPELFTLVK
jgi:hypothetical protein